MSCRVIVVGHGRMGRLIEALAPAHEVEIAGIVSRDSAGTLDDRERWARVDVVIDVSQPQAFVTNLPRLCALGANLVVGTTGWQADQARVRSAIEAAGIGAVVAANFSVGANLLDALVERAAALFEPHGPYGAFIHEAHHAAKKDAPSGTALSLRSALERGGLSRGVDMSSTRAGHIPGTHTVGFDGPAESVTLTHAVRDRATFAHGALVAARWVRGRRGWFTMRQVLGLE